MRINLEELIENGIITHETADSIEKYYKQQQESNPNRLLLIFAVLGALLIGAGIILIIGHNWDYFPRALKTFLSFLPLIITQGLAVFVILKKYDNPIWREAVAVTLFFAIGASISLVSQVYHIVGDIKSFLFIWMILAIPVVYLLKSRATLLLVIAGATSYGQQVGYFHQRQVPIYYWLMIVSIIPFCYQLYKELQTRHSMTFILWVLTGSITILMGSFVINDSPMLLFLYMSYFGLLYLMGVWYKRKTISFIKNPFLVIGCLGIIVLLFISGFQDFWQSVNKPDNIISFAHIDTYVWICLTILASGLFMYLFTNKEIDILNPIGYAFLVFILIYGLSFIDPLLSVICSNLLLLAISISLILRGNHELDLRLLNIGLAIILILIIARFFDFDIPFIVRGIIFIVLGIAFFMANYGIIQKRKNQ